MMPRLLRRLAIAFLSLMLLVAAWDWLTYDSDAWLADYAQLKQDMAQGYANLDWVATHRGLDPVQLDRDTQAALASAHSRLRAFLALRRFIAAFDDPHLKLVKSQPATTFATPVHSARPAARPADPGAGADCSAAGYSEGEHGFAFPAARLPGWQSLSEGDFPSGLAGKTGFLRIAQFGENRYASMCEKVFRAGIGQRELQLAVREGLQQSLRESLATLRARGASTLVIDLGGNGGGSEWSQQAAALMTNRTMSREGVRMANPQCDRSGFWQGAAACPGLAPAGEQLSLQGTGAWTGPVLVLADRGTASASEDFIAWLHQAGVARVVGEHTMGAGCGYVGGGHRSRLKVIPMDVLMPNCARLLKDGRNEIEGIKPDVALASDGDEAARAAALASLLPH